MQPLIDSLCNDIITYLAEVQERKPGEFHGSFWSEKAYHAPLLDWHGGGAHHHRGAGSAGLALAMTGIPEHKYRAEQTFDWLAARQHVRGGWVETQNNDLSSDWEYTGMEELSNIETSFVVRGMAQAVLRGLPPKKSYLDAMKKAGLWYIGMETPAWSGTFPHHERSPYDTLNGTMHAVEALGYLFHAIEKAYGININIFRAAAFRGMRHLATQQTGNGDFPYRTYGGITINYTALVVYLMLNFQELWSEQEMNSEKIQLRGLLEKSADFLCGCVDSDGSLKWEKFETSCAKHNVWTYVLVWNVLRRLNRTAAAERLFAKILALRTASGLLPMRDCGEEITRCAYMQADMLLFLLPFSKYGGIR